MKQWLSVAVVASVLVAVPVVEGQQRQHVHSNNPNKGIEILSTVPVDPDRERVVVRMTMKPGSQSGGGNPMTHGEDRTYYVLAGTVMHYVSGKPVALKPGAIFELPAHSPHMIRNASGRDATVLLVAVKKAGAVLETCNGGGD